MIDFNVWVGLSLCFNLSIKHNGKFNGGWNFPWKWGSYLGHIFERCESCCSWHTLSTKFKLMINSILLEKKGIELCGINRTCHLVKANWKCF